MNTYIVLGAIASLFITLPDCSSGHALYAATTEVTDPTDVTDWTPNPICPFPSDEKTFAPYEGDCTKYWQCFEGNAVMYQCEPGLWWHQEILTCDYPGDYCDGRTGTADPDTTVPTVPTETPTEVTETTSSGSTRPDVDPRCPSDGHTAYFPHPENCNMYIECYEGGSYEMSCENHLYYSEAAEACVDAVDSECCQDTDQC